MDWSEEISFSCFNAAWKTFDTYFGHGKISFRTLSTTYIP